MKTTTLSASELRGLAKLGFSTAVGVTDIVEQMHATISRRPLPIGAPIEAPARGIAGFVYSSIRGAMLLPAEGSTPRWVCSVRNRTSRVSRGRDIALAVLNGVAGDRLVATENPLALGMSLRPDGRALTLDRDFARRGSAGCDRAHCRARARPLHERSAMAAQKHDHGACAAREDLGYHAGLSLLQFRPAHFRERPRLRGHAGATRSSHWPVAGRRTRHHRPQHGRAGRAQRLPLCASAPGFRGVANCASWCFSERRIMARRSSASDRGSTSRSARFPIPRRSIVSDEIRSAGITDLRYGALLDEDWKDHDRFARHADRRAGSRCRKTSPATRLRPRPPKRRAAFATALSATGSCRLRARSENMATPGARLRSLPATRRS